MAIELEQRAIVPDILAQKIVRQLDRLSIPEAPEFRFTLVNLPNGRFAQDVANKIDIKLRTNGKLGRLTVKEGSWHSDAARIEREVFFQHREFAAYLSILVCLKKYYWIAMYTRRMMYRTERLIYTIDEHYFSGDRILEIEALQDSKDHQEVEKEINGALSGLGLRAADSRQTRALITRLNRVRKSRIDFKRNSVDAFIRDFCEFVDCKFRWHHPASK
jgi:adenylate cyclase class IV